MQYNSILAKKPKIFNKIFAGLKKPLTFALRFWGILKSKNNG